MVPKRVLGCQHQIESPQRASNGDCPLNFVCLRSFKYITNSSPTPALPYSVLSNWASWSNKEGVDKTTRIEKKSAGRQQRLDLFQSAGCQNLIGPLTPLWDFNQL